MCTEVRKQMEPSTTEQEKPLSFDTEQNQAREYESGKEVEMLDCSNAENKTSTNGDPLLISGNTEDVESSVSNDTGLRQSAEEGETSALEDFQKEPAYNGSLDSPEAPDEPPISDSNPIEQAADKIFDVNTLEPSVVGSNLENSFVDHPNSGSSISNVAIQSESNAVIETSITHEEFLKSGHAFSTIIVEQSEEHLVDASPKNIGEVSVDEKVESSLGEKFNGTVLPREPSLPDESYQSGYQHLLNDQKDNVSQTFFESTKPGSFFTSAGIPAPSLVPAALQSPPGKVLVPAALDQLQSQAFSALQVLKVG